MSAEPKILVVDDDPLMLNLVAETLDGLGYALQDSIGRR